MARRGRRWNRDWKERIVPPARQVALAVYSQATDGQRKSTARRECWFSHAAARAVLPHAKNRLPGGTAAGLHEESPGYCVTEGVASGDMPGMPPRGPRAPFAWISAILSSRPVVKAAD